MISVAHVGKSWEIRRDTGASPGKQANWGESGENCENPETTLVVGNPGKPTERLRNHKKL